jgi:manganese transport protein
MTTFADPAPVTVALAATPVRTRPLRLWPRTGATALLVSAGYLDPGNWATDLAAGARFGMRLVWVVAIAIVLALFLQQLAARLGLGSGCDLAQLLRQRCSPLVRWTLTPPILLALAITEVVEVLGVIVGVRLLTGLPAGTAVVVAAVLLTAVLAAPAGAGRVAVFGCLAVVTVVYLVVLLRSGLHQTVTGLAPRALPAGGLPVALGILGAIVMPHNLLLHSTLARQLRRGDPLVADDPDRARTLLSSTVRTSGLALAGAFAVNCSIMSLTARATGPAGGNDGISSAYRELAPVLGQATSMLFALSLIAAGLASSVTGGMAAAESLRQLVPALRLAPVARRLSCLVPAAAVCLCGMPEGSVLVWSQVVLSLVLPLVLFPLIAFVSDPKLMGSLVIGRGTRTLAQLIAVGISVLAAAAILLS